MNRERERTHYVEELKEKGYDIEDVVKTFISLIFEEEL
jgi:biotin operon repressor